MKTARMQDNKKGRKERTKDGLKDGNKGSGMNDAKD